MKLSKFLVILIIFICLVNISSKKIKDAERDQQKLACKTKCGAVPWTMYGLKISKSKVFCLCFQESPKVKDLYSGNKKGDSWDFNMKFSSQQARDTQISQFNNDFDNWTA